MALALALASRWTDPISARLVGPSSEIMYTELSVVQLPSAGLLAFS